MAPRGRLKLYLGYAAGVGKTQRLLEEAHALAGRGVDCVVGLVATLAAGALVAGTGAGRPETLATLRELALREVAESLGRAPARPSTGRRVMVCLSSFGTRAAALLQRGSRMAGRLNTDWFVVHV